MSGYLHAGVGVGPAPKRAPWWEPGQWRPGIEVVFTPPLKGDEGYHCTGTLGLQEVRHCLESGGKAICWERRLDFKVSLAIRNITQPPKGPGAWYLKQILERYTEWKLVYEDGTGDSGNFRVDREEYFRLKGVGGNLRGGPDHHSVRLPHCSFACSMISRTAGWLNLVWLASGSSAATGDYYLTSGEPEGDLPPGFTIGEKRSPETDQLNPTAKLASDEGTYEHYVYNQTIDHCPCPVPGSPVGPEAGAPSTPGGENPGGPSTPGGESPKGPRTPQPPRTLLPGDRVGRQPWLEWETELPGPGDWLMQDMVRARIGGSHDARSGPADWLLRHIARQRGR